MNPVTNHDCTTTKNVKKSSIYSSLFYAIYQCSINVLRSMDGPLQGWLKSTADVVGKELVDSFLHPVANYGSEAVSDLFIIPHQIQKLGCVDH